MYLYPSRVDLLGSSAMVVGEHPYPDVVLEVDHTTDVRRGKLRLYEAWGFPEVWVEAPERRTPSRPRGTLPGLTIHLLEEGAYRKSPWSLAFPGWRAEAIHDALNEVEPSAWTHARLERLGRTLGEQRPDDDPLLRSLRGESREEGRAEGREEGEARGEARGRAEGLAEGEARGRAKMARQILRSRGIEVSEGFPANLPGFHESSEEAVASPALACESEEDFLTRLRRPGCAR